MKANRTFLVSDSGQRLPVEVVELRLRIEQVDLAWRSLEEDEDAARAFAGKCGGLGASGLTLGTSSAARS